MYLTEFIDGRECLASQVNAISIHMGVDHPNKEGHLRHQVHRANVIWLFP